MKKTIVFLLCGLTGSGKTTYAKSLEKEGSIRLSLDEEVFRKYGKYGIGYPKENHLELEEKVRKNLDKQLIKLIKSQKSVVLDYGLWAKTRRDYYKQLVEKNGGEWKLVYFKVKPELLIKRLEKRNLLDDNNSLYVSREMLDGFIKRFEEPLNEGEIVS